MDLATTDALEADPAGKIAENLAHFADGEAEFYTCEAKEGWRVRGCCEAARLPRLKAAGCRQSRADRFDKVLLARCAGVHVDFHAHRHFDNLRSFPGHLGLPSSLARCRAAGNVELPRA